MDIRNIEIFYSSSQFYISNWVNNMISISRLLTYDNDNVLPCILGDSLIIGPIYIYFNLTIVGVEFWYLVYSDNFWACLLI